MPSAADTRREGSGRDPKLTIRRLLLIRPGAIGDTIVSIPALEYLREQADYCEVWVTGVCTPLMQFADRVRSIASTGLDLLELGFDTPAIAALESFDRIVSWYGTSRTDFRQAVSRFPIEFHKALPTEGCGIAAADWYLQQIGAPPGAVPAIRISPSSKRDFIACQPFSGSARKNWSIDRFQQLSRNLPCPVEFCIGPDDPALDGAHLFPSLLELAEWLASARGYVGNDSGPSHLAAATGVPAVTIFRCTDPVVWAPRGRNSVTVLTGEPSVPEVTAALGRILRGTGT